MGKAARRYSGHPRQIRNVLLPGLAGNENFHIQYERRVDNIFNDTFPPISTISLLKVLTLCYSVQLETLIVIYEILVWH